MYNRKHCCWNCGKEGHLRTECPEPKQKICSHCRRPNILSKDCACQKPPKSILQILTPGGTPSVMMKIGTGSMIATLSSADPFSIAGREAIELARNNHIQLPQFTDDEWASMRNNRQATYYAGSIPISIKGIIERVECILDPFSSRPFTLGMNAMRAFGFSIMFMGDEVNHRTRPIAMIPHGRYPIESLRTEQQRSNQRNSRSDNIDRSKSTTMKKPHTKSSTETHKNYKTLKTILYNFMEDMKKNKNKEIKTQTSQNKNEGTGKSGQSPAPIEEIEGPSTSNFTSPKTTHSEIEGPSTSTSPPLRTSNNFLMDTEEDQLLYSDNDVLDYEDTTDTL